MTSGWGIPIAAPAAASYAAGVLADSPIVYWRLQETSGSLVSDATGNLHGGTVVGSPTFNQPGAAAISGKSVSLSGGGGAFYCNDAPMFGNTAMSIEAWVKFTTTTNSLVIAALDNQGAAPGNAKRVWNLRTANSGKLQLVILPTTGSVFLLDTPSTCNDGVWHHVAATLAGGNSALYVDGASVATGTYTGSLSTGVSSNPYVVGANNEAGFGDQVRFLGSIAEPAYYGGALSAARIAAHYTQGITGP